MSILGYIKGHLDIPYRPANIDADAAAILNSATRSVKHIRDHRAALDHRGLHNVPLVVMLGEDHSIISNQAHHISVVREVMKYEEIAVAFEMYHDYFFRKLNKSGYSDSVEKMKACDLEEGGALSLKADVVMSTETRAPFGSFAFKHMLLRHKIKTCFCDVAATVNPYRCIDKTDPSSLESLRFFFGDDLPEKTDMIEASGSAVRSHHMAKMTIDFAVKNHLRIVFLQSGDAHVIGCEGEDFKARNGSEFEGKNFGLASFLKQSPVSSVGILLKGIGGLRKNSGWTDEKILVSDDLPQISAAYNPFTGRPKKGFMTYDICSEAAESLYLNDLLSRTGNATEMVTSEVRRRLQAQYRDDLETAITRVSENSSPQPA